MARPQLGRNAGITNIHTSTLSRVRASLPTSFRDSVRSGRQLVTDGSATNASLLSTSVAAVDRLLDGGLPRGRLVELTGKRSCGRFSTLLTTLAAVTSRGESATLVDLGDGFDPQAAKTFGVELERLLWIRPTDIKTALASAELTLHTGFSLVAIDLGLAPIPGGRGNEAAWLRLARATVEHGTALLVSSPYRVTSTAATAVLTTEAVQARWNGHGHVPPLLSALDGRLCIDKSRLALKRGAEFFRLATPAGRLMPLPTPLVYAQDADVEQVRHLVAR